MTRDEQRKRLIRLIHVGKNELHMADDTYRGIVAAHANGKTSTADCTLPELDRVLAHIKSAGFKVRKPKAARPAERRPLDPSAEAAKARALWLWLHQVGIVKNPSEAALAAFAKRTCGVDALQWARRLDKLIEGIKAWSARELETRLAARFNTLQARGVPTGAGSLATLLEGIGGARKPDSFNVLQEAWEYLDQVEADHKAQQDGAACL